MPMWCDNHMNAYEAATMISFFALVAITIAFGTFWLTRK